MHATATSCGRRRCLRLGELARPGVGVAYHRARKVLRLCQVWGAFLGHAQRAKPGIECFRLPPRGGEPSELDLNAVDVVLLRLSSRMVWSDDDGDLPGPTEPGRAAPT